MPPAASYVGTDTATLGTWTGTYGTNGQVIPNDVSNLPGYAVLSTTGASTYTWAASTTDPRALQISSGSSSRLASAYQSSSSFTLDLNLTDGNTHRISLYLCDWDNSGRTETITVVNAATQAVLSTKTFSSFSGGIYAVWDIAGHVQIQVTDTAVANAIVNAIFFDPLPSATWAPGQTYKLTLCQMFARTIPSFCPLFRVQTRQNASFCLPNQVPPWRKYSCLARRNSPRRFLHSPRPATRSH